MKILSREFTVREKVLLLILLLFLALAGYYRFIYQATEDVISESNRKSDDLELELTTLQIKLSQMEKMNAELEEEKANDALSYMFSYNNINAEIEFLHQLLDTTTQEYKLNFASVTREGDLIRRPISITFTVDDYRTAEKIIENLERCQMRCLVRQVQMNAAAYNKEVEAGEVQGLHNSVVNVSCSVIFYETMAGGTEDAGLQTNIQ